MLLNLPSDVWECIDAFLQCDVLSQVCRRLWQFLGRRYLRVTCQCQKKRRTAMACCSRARILHLGLWLCFTNSPTFMDRFWARVLGRRSRSVGDSCAWDLAVLMNATALHRLTLALQENSIGCSGARALAALKDAPSLHTLQLNLRSNSIQRRGAQALAALKDAPLLHTLMLDLACNSIGDAGLRALATLRDAPSLHNLKLDLGGNSIGCSGA